MREEGYYKVKIWGEWHVMKWDTTVYMGYWLKAGFEDEFGKDDILEEIGERIELP